MITVPGASPLRDSPPGNSSLCPSSVGLSQLGSSHHEFFHFPQYTWSLSTCEGDLGLAGAGDAGASVWLGLAVGLGMGEGSSGGDGVFAMRRGPESLDAHIRVSNGPSQNSTYLSGALHPTEILRHNRSCLSSIPTSRLFWFLLMVMVIIGTIHCVPDPVHMLSLITTTLMRYCPHFTRK